MLAARVALAGVAGLALGAFCMFSGACDSEPAEAPGSDVEAGSDAPIADGPFEARPPSERCTADVDCTPPNGCYAPHCDVVLGACTYALCEAKGRACAAGRCDTKAFTCSAAKDYGLRTTRYKVDATTLGCATSASACFAAIYPFVFIGTKEDVVIVRADDLLATSASKVMRAGPAVRPSRVVASARRLWIIGEAQGTAPPYQLPIAWIDVPSNPTVASLVSQGTTVSWPYPDALAFPAPDAGLFLAYGDVAEGFPAAVPE